MNQTAMNRTSAIQRVLWLVLVLNLLVGAAKLTIGFSINSLAMIADGFHSVLDGTSNVIGLFGIFVASRPPDADHPYGHQKFEAFAALAIAVLLAITAFQVVQTGMDRLFDDSRPIPTVIGFFVMAITMGVNVFVTRYEAWQGRKLKSGILLADAAHTRSDIFVSLSVVAGLGAVWLEIFWLDLVVAFMIAGFILYIAYGVLKQVSSELTDTTFIDPAQIRRVVLGIPEVIFCTNIRSRGRTPNLFIDLEIQVDPDLPLRKSHHIAHVVIDACRAAFEATDVIVHAEPAELSHRQLRAGYDNKLQSDEPVKTPVAHLG